jgi:hypothetical protein
VGATERKKVFENKLFNVKPPPMTLPQEISDRINAEARKAAIIVEWQKLYSGPNSSASMHQVSRVDPNQKEFYIKGATEWAGKAQEVIDAAEKVAKIFAHAGDHQTCAICGGECGASSF